MTEEEVSKTEGAEFYSTCKLMYQSNTISWALAEYRLLDQRKNTLLITAKGYADISICVGSLSPNSHKD